MRRGLASPQESHPALGPSGPLALALRPSHVGPPILMKDWRPDHSTKFNSNRSITFWDILVTNKQTDIHTYGITLPYKFVGGGVAIAVTWSDSRYHTVYLPLVRWLMCSVDRPRPISISSRIAATSRSRDGDQSSMMGRHSGSSLGALYGHNGG